MHLCNTEENIKFAIWKHGNRYRKNVTQPESKKPKRKAGKKGGKTLTDAENQQKMKQGEVGVDFRAPQASS